MKRIVVASLWGIGALAAFLYCVFFIIGMIVNRRYPITLLLMVTLVAFAGAKGVVMMLSAYHHKS